MRNTADHLAVWYWSPIVSGEIIDEMRFLEEMKKLFLSMRAVK